MVLNCTASPGSCTRELVYATGRRAALRERAAVRPQPVNNMLRAECWQRGEALGLSFRSSTHDCARR